MHNLDQEGVWGPRLPISPLWAGFFRQIEESGSEWRNSKKPIIEEYTLAYLQNLSLLQDVGLVPTSYQYNNESILFWDPEIIDVEDLDGPGGLGNHSKRRGAKHPAFWSGFWGPRGRPDPNNR